jgi:AhpD family alkylhydroperoxidase
MAEPVGLGSVAWEPCVLARHPDPALTRYVRGQLGFVPDYLDYYTVCPWVARQFVYWDTTQIPILALPPALVEMIDLVVAQDNSCRYCYAATTLLLRALGFGDEAIRALEQDVTTSPLPPATRTALDLARRFSRASPLLDSSMLTSLAQHGFDTDAMREIVYVAALAGIANRVVTMAAVPVEGIERLSRRWWVRLLKPLLTFAAWRARRNARPTPLSDAMREGPFRQLVNAFDGHPLGPRLWTQIDEAWRSEILPRRTKALITAVIGRALGCSRSEDEARRLLRADGVSLDLAPVLANLASPELTEAEAVIIPFVRETVHYSPAQIQRRGRVVYERLGQAAFVETVGMAALANALCRMTAVLADGRA